MHGFFGNRLEADHMLADGVMTVVVYPRPVIGE
jgi:hypothetical protein